MLRATPPVLLSPDQNRELQRWLAALGTPQQVALRSRIVLALAAGQKESKVAVENQVNRKTVRLWRIPAVLKEDPKRIKLWTQVHTGMEMDELGELHPLDNQTWQERRKQLMQAAPPPP